MVQLQYLPAPVLIWPTPRVWRARGETSQCHCTGYEGHTWKNLSWLPLMQALERLV